MYLPKTDDTELNESRNELRDIHKNTKIPVDKWCERYTKFPQKLDEFGINENHNGVQVRDVAKDIKLKEPNMEWLKIDKIDEIPPTILKSDPYVNSMPRGFEVIPSIPTVASMTPQATATTTSHHNTHHTTITAINVLIFTIVVGSSILFLYFIYLIIIRPLCKGAKYIFKNLSRLRRLDLESGRRMTLHELVSHSDIPLHGLNPPLSLPVYPARVYRVGRYTGDDHQRNERGGNWIVDMRARGDALVRTDSNATQWERDLSPAVLLTGTGEGASVLSSNLRPVIPADEDEVAGRRKWNESAETLVRSRSYVSVLSLA